MTSKRPRAANVDALVDAIYDAAVRPTGWGAVAQALDQAFDSAVHIVINLPGSIPRQFFPSGLLPGFAESYGEHLVRGLPYSSAATAGFFGRFADSAEVWPEIQLEETGFFREWMEPQGLAAHWPLVHIFTIGGDLPVGGISLFRREGTRGFAKTDLELGNQLVPHLARAIHFYSTLDGVQRERLALAEVIDRLPTGVILIDSERRPVIRNRSADRVVELADGFHVDGRGPYAGDARENATLQKLLADALEAEPGHELQATGFMAISRPSGARSFPVMVTRLLAAEPGSTAKDAVVAIFITNPEADQVAGPERLETLYDLTAAEAELVRLLSEGRSLEDVATARGVSIHTARSHLKHVFAKTDTNRQGELVRLVLTGVSSIRNA